MKTLPRKKLLEFLISINESKQILITMARRQCANKSTKPPIWEDGIYKRDEEDLPSASANAAQVLKTPTPSPLVDGKGFSIELIPVEILFFIIEKLDFSTYISCLHVSQRWRSVALSIANAEKDNQRWKYIHDVCLVEETYIIKSLNLPYKEMFANSLRWYIPFSFLLLKTYTINYVKKINIYKDNIIVIDSIGVKYYDVHTSTLKKSLKLYQCYDFIERDAFVLICTQDKSDGVSDSKLFLYGKKDPNDTSFEEPVQRVLNFGANALQFQNAIIISVVSQFTVEYNCCYIMNSHSNVLSCYIWHRNQWDVLNLGRFYANRDDKVYALSVLCTEVYLLIKWGQMLKYSYEKRNFTEVCRVRLLPNRHLFVKMVHKFCLVIGVPGDCEFRVTRMRNNDGYNFYKFECPNLTCVQQHGDMLLLGYTDGRVELFMPRATRREDMLKGRIYISQLTKGPIDPENLMVISMEVFEFVGEHYLFIATHTAIYQLRIKHDDDICIWDFIPERPKDYGQPLARYCS